MALISDTESRPALTGYEDRNQPLYSEFEDKEKTEIIRKYEQKNDETVLDLTINQIIDNTVDLTANFMDEYSLKMKEVSLEYDLYEEEDTLYTNLKKYIIAFLLYLGDKDNIIYVGVLLVVLSIILYFFNISSV
jgi:hypothetical protein